MPAKNDDIPALLREIRDLQREQVAFQRAQSELAEHDRRTSRLMHRIRLGVTLIAVLFVLGAYIYVFRAVGAIF